MSHENKQNKQNGSRRKNKKTSQATVLKQLNDQSLYPLRERIGIYFIATLSIIGLILISYTGVMAFVNTVGNGPATADVDIDLDAVDDMLGDLEGILASIDDDDEEPTQDENELHQYVEPTEPEEEPTEPEEEPTEPEEELTEPEEEPTEPETNRSDAPTQGTINADSVFYFAVAGGDSILGQLNMGDVVQIIDWDYSPYWVAIEVENQWGIPVVYVERHFLNID